MKESDKIINRLEELIRANPTNQFYKRRLAALKGTQEPETETETEPETPKNCAACGKELRKTQKTFCSKKCKEESYPA